MRGIRSVFCILVMSAIFISGSCTCIPKGTGICSVQITECNGERPVELPTYYFSEDGTKCFVCSICAANSEVCPAVPIARRDIWKRWRIPENCTTSNPVTHFLWVDVDAGSCFGGELYIC